MELKPGYKQTEVGVIPEDWDCKNLRELCKKITDGTHDTPKPVANGIPFLTAIHIKESGIDYENCLYLKKEDHEIIFARCNPQQGDVLLVNIGAGVATTAVVSVDYEFSLKNVALLKPSAELLGSYLNYCLSIRKEAIVHALSSGGAQPFLSLSEIAEIQVPAPALAEQEQISQALIDSDALLVSLERLIAKKSDMKQAAMQELLTGKRRLPGFEGEWEAKRLGDHVRFLKNGVNSRAELCPGACVRYLHYGDIHASSGSFLSPQDLTGLPVDKATGLDRLQDGDLIFADASEDIAGVSRSVELCGTSDFEAVSGLHTIAARFDKAILADGFKGFLQYVPSFSMHLRRLAAGTKVYATNRAHISSAEVRLPPVAEQQAIANVLIDMSNEIGVLRERKNKACSTKQGMMQQLLTGKIRLT
jgi:type I restriction enzyme S subunit